MGQPDLTGGDRIAPGPQEVAEFGAMVHGHPIQSITLRDDEPLGVCTCESATGIRATRLATQGVARRVARWHVNADGGEIDDRQDQS